jgi:hypothetical protein
VSITGVGRGEFLTTERIDLIAREPESAVLGHHLGVQGRIGVSVRVGVVLLSVQLDDNPLPVAEEDQEIHPLTSQRLVLRLGSGSCTGHSGDRPAG